MIFKSLLANLKKGNLPSMDGLLYLLSALLHPHNGVWCTWFPKVYFTIDDKRGWTGNALICGFYPRYGTPYIALYIPSSPFGKMATCSKFVSKPDAGTKQAMKNAFSRILDDLEFSLPTPRIEQAKECIRYLQTKQDMTRTLPQATGRKMLQCPHTLSACKRVLIKVCSNTYCKTWVTGFLIGAKVWFPLVHTLFKATHIHAVKKSVKSSDKMLRFT